jgi:hypothetical protein
VVFRRDLHALSPRTASGAAGDSDGDQALPPVPAWITALHLLAMAWTVTNSHFPALFLGGFMFFLGFTRVTAAYQGRMDSSNALVGSSSPVSSMAAASLRIAPVLASLSQAPLFGLRRCSRRSTTTRLSRISARSCRT